MSMFECPKCGATLQVSVPKTKQTIDVTIDYVKMLFPKDLEELLVFTEGEKFIIVRPRQFLGSETFAKIASVIREAGGEYISAGKESHFRIAKK